MDPRRCRRPARLDALSDYGGASSLVNHRRHKSDRRATPRDARSLLRPRSQLQTSFTSHELEFANSSVNSPVAIHVFRTTATTATALCGQLTFRLAWCREHSVVMATELLQRGTSPVELSSSPAA